MEKFILKHLGLIGFCIWLITAAAIIFTILIYLRQ